jgi:hypothetical protein
MPGIEQAERCPHCGSPLAANPELGYREARLRHLVEHALQAALKLSPEDVPDRSFWEAAEACEEDTWQDAALMAHDEVLFVIDSVGGLSETAQDKAENRALKWLATHYPSGSD